MCPEICPEICENFCPEIFFGCAQACRYRYRYSADAGTGLLSLISYALQHRILLRRENPTYRYWAPVAAARHGLFTAGRGNTFVGGTCALPSALLVGDVC